MGPRSGLSNSEFLTGCCSESPGVEYATYEMKVENWNMGTRINRPAPEPDYPRRLGKVDHEGGACVVVGTRENRTHGEGRQGTDGVVETEKPLMDLGDQADNVWLLNVQRKLYQWSRNHPEDSYRDLWNWATDIRNLRCAWRQIALNQGRRTAGADGMTVAGIREAIGTDLFLDQILVSPVAPSLAARASRWELPSTAPADGVKMMSAGEAEASSAEEQLAKE